MGGSQKHRSPDVSEALARAAAATRVFCVDVDGTLTDGGMYYTDAGEAMKRFNTRDAMGMGRLRERGIQLAIVTSEDSPIVLARARKLNIPHVFVGVKDKVGVLEGLLKDLGFTWEQLAYVGDDLNDLPVIRKAGFSACPADAAPEVARSATYVCKARGGHGAVREVCNLILAALEGGTDAPCAGAGTQGRLI
jgi:N-acylneuraminate cytidylyltransferase